MKKKFLVLLLTLTMILSFSPYVAKAADTDDTDSSNKTDTIDGRTYFYDQFDNSAYRTVYNQINDAAQKFNESTSNASYQDGGYYTAFTLSVSNKDWEVIGNDGMDQIVNAVLADHPEYFWMSDSYQCKQESSGELRYTALTIECYSLYANGDTRSIYKNNFDLTVKNYAASLDESAKDYEKVYLIHNSIINKVIMLQMQHPRARTTYTHTPQTACSTPSISRQSPTDMQRLSRPLWITLVCHVCTLRDRIQIFWTTRWTHRSSSKKRVTSTTVHGMPFISAESGISSISVWTIL
ncbi:hypothetical protein [Coprococcus sp. OM06-25]|uniref:hypothetical protein n=1 Tax=Coprococcus sp. OM06-25 TaxID=2293094 RepID=UPI001FA8B14B|nr:hypothetical protein [Coprococcus sp. OM06-25]